MTESSRVERLGVSLYAPWQESPKETLKAVQERIDCDAVLVGIVSAQRPRPDELLVAHGFSKGDAVEKWITSGFRKDALVKAAMKQGVASGTANQSSWGQAGLAGSTCLAYQMIPESLAERRWWLVIVARKGAAFDQEELDALNVLLRRWKSHYNRPRERDMARLIIGHDDRLIHSDPNGQELLRDCNVNIPEMMIDLRETVEQRWPKLKDNELHDVALELAEEPWWIRFRRQRAVDSDTGAYWYVEVRPLEDDELTPVGLVPDDRIAEALAYIHDHYNQSPSLNEVSSAVHISPFHFHRLFSKQAGTTPKQYVLQKQIQMAKWMLRAQRMPISQIAAETGFASHGHFTSTFRRFIGVSPSQYRAEEFV
ncbi:MAG: helix-turn-helix transcriptional regulator [Phycisphaerales bacterium]